MTYDDNLDLELQNLARADQPPISDLPDPAIIWFKAEMLRKRRLREEAVRPMIWVQRVGIVLAVLTLAGLMLTGVARGLVGTPSAGVISLQLVIVLIGFLAVLVWSYRSATVE